MSESRNRGVRVSHNYSQQLHVMAGGPGAQLGTVLLRHAYDFRASSTARFLLTGDPTGDGRGDFFVVETLEHPCTSALYFGARAAISRVTTTLGGRCTPPGNLPEVADFNGDGVSDLFWRWCSDTPYTMAVLNYGRRDPTGSNITAELMASPLPACAAHMGSPTEGVSHEIGDFNGDGIDDLDVILRSSTSATPRLRFLGGPDGLVAERCAVVPRGP